MKIRLDTHARLSGKILLVTIFIGAAIGIVLASCLTLVKSQNQAVARSQAWNACIPVIEAGIEEAMAHVNNPNTTTLASLASSGWQQNGSVFSRPPRPMGDGFYLVNITLTNVKQPVIVCTGYVRLPVVVGSAQHTMVAAAGTSVNGVQYIGRTVEVVARKQRLFVHAMVAKLGVDMNGNGIATDSYNSSNALYSTNGKYDPAKAHDRGDVSTISGLQNSLTIGNADIKGRLQTGPGGSVSIGPGGVVGSMAWHLGGNTGIEPGAYTDDLNISLPDVLGPSTGGAFSPGAATVGGVSYKYVLGNAKYQLSALDLASKEKMAVTGHAVLIVHGNVSIAGKVEILPGGTLEIYVAGASTTIGGQGVFNGTGQATNFVYYGLPTNRAIGLPSNGDFTGAIYAPQADLNLAGGGSTILHFSGACVARSIGVNGHYKFHYDEALGETGPESQYVIISWVEL
jgi:hypothetical protein